MRDTLGRIAWLAAVGILVAACGAGASQSPGAMPTASPGPTTGSPVPTASLWPSPTPIGSPVATLEEAAAVVIASDPRFAGVTRRDPNVVGASAWWEGRALTDGFQVMITIGWGDCPAGCINRHVWTFHVAADGTLTLLSESGDPLPAGSPGLD
jgi:hypothetical protein